MRKSNKKILSAIVVLMLAVFLTACGYSAEMKAGTDGLDCKFKGLTQSKPVEVQTAFGFDEGVIRVELEKGTVDIKIVSIIPDEEDSEKYTEVDTIYEGTGLADGDEAEISGVHTDIFVSISGDSASGTVTITPKE